MVSSEACPPQRSAAKGGDGLMAESGEGCLMNMQSGSMTMMMSSFGFACRTPAPRPVKRVPLRTPPAAAAAKRACDRQPQRSILVQARKRFLEGVLSKPRQKNQAASKTMSLSNQRKIHGLV